MIATTTNVRGRMSRMVIQGSCKGRPVNSPMTRRTETQPSRVSPCHTATTITIEIGSVS